MQLNDRNAFIGCKGYVRKSNLDLHKPKSGYAKPINKSKNRIKQKYKQPRLFFNPMPLKKYLNTGVSLFIIERNKGNTTFLGVYEREASE